MRYPTRLTLFLGAMLCSQAHAFDFAISKFTVVRAGVTLFEDTFASTFPPTAPAFASGTSAGTPATYTVPAGTFAAAVNGKLKLNSASASISPAVSTTLAIGAHVNINIDPTSTAGLKPSTTFEVSGVWDALNPTTHPGEGYLIELGDWVTLPAPQGKTCECVRLGVVRQSDGTVLIRFWRNSIGNDSVSSNTTIGTAAFSPGTNQQILLKLKKASATSNAVTASYAYVNNGVAGTETAISGTTDLFTARQYAMAAFKAFTPLASATSAGTNKNLSVTANVNVAGTHVNKTGNIYVAALYNGAVFFNNGSGWVLWTSGNFPAYATGVSLADRSINVLSGLDVSGLTGAIILVGYGTSQQDLISNQAYNIVYTVQ